MRSARMAWMIRSTLTVAAMLVATAITALTASPAAAQPKGGGGLPPFLAKMQRHPMTVAVKMPRPGGGLDPAGAGLTVGVTIQAAGSKVSEYTAVTDEQGEARFAAVPSNPEVQGAITYAVQVDHGGVRFPFDLDGVPGDEARVEVVVTAVTTDLATVEADHSIIELFPDEESIVVRHQLTLLNTGDKTVDLGALPGGGLKLSMPVGAKHPELHDENDPMAEVRGTDVFFKGALLPSSMGQPAVLQVVYTLDYDGATWDFDQTLPVPVRGAMVVAPQDKQDNQRVAVPLELTTVGAYGAVSPSTLPGGETFQVLRSDGARLAAGEAFRFRIGNVPAPSKVGHWAMLGACVAVALLVLFGFRREAGAKPRLSKAHLVTERDRLVRALARMRKAVDRGRMSEARFEREREAITARLVSLYRALDRLEPR